MTFPMWDPEICQIRLQLCDYTFIMRKSLLYKAICLYFLI